MQLIRIFIAVVFLLPRIAAGENGIDNSFYAMDTVALRGKDVPVEQQLDDLKALGYAGLSLTGVDVCHITSLIQAAETRGLTVHALYTPFPLSKTNGLAIPDNLDALLQALAGHQTVMWVYIQSKDFAPSSPDGDALAVPALQTAADRAAPYGIKLALYPHAYFWVQTMDDGLRLAKAVNRPNFGISFNLCHALRMGDEARIPDLLRLTKPWLHMVTLNGADSGAAADTGWGRLIQPLGRGSYDIERLLRLLKNLGYTGPIGFQGFGIKEDRLHILRETMTAWKQLTGKIMP